MKIKINKKCKNCEFNFDGICAGHSDLYEYGSKILDMKKVCEMWGIDIKYFCKLRDKLLKISDIDLVVKIQKELDIDFSLIRKKYNKYIWDLNI